MGGYGVNVSCAWAREQYCPGLTERAAIVIIGLTGVSPVAARRPSSEMSSPANSVTFLSDSPLQIVREFSVGWVTAL